MKLSYRRTFSQFADNYLSTYYTGAQTLRRVAYGPLLMVVGSILVVAGRNPQTFILLRWLLALAGLAGLLYGLFLTLRPFIDLALVYLRRAEFLGPEGSQVTLELGQSALRVDEASGTLEVPYSDIQAVQYRARGAWIITQSDHLIPIPTADLTAGDADTFLAALDLILNPPEE